MKALALAAVAFSLMSMPLAAEPAAADKDEVQMEACDISTYVADGVNYARLECVDWKTGAVARNDLVNELDDPITYAALAAMPKELDCVVELAIDHYSCHPALDTDGNTVEQ